MTRIIADVIVSSDDVYLSRGGGEESVSRTISRAAGDSLTDDIQKFSLPLTLGSVAVTSAGQLPAKYIFHAITLDFSTHPSMQALVAHLIRRILKIGVALEINHIALPLLGTGFVGFSREQVLACIFSSTAYCLASPDFPWIEQISITIFGSSDELQPVIKEIEKKTGQAEVMQQRIRKLRAICAEMPEDKDLNDMLNARIDSTTSEMRQLFYFKEMDDSISLGKNAGVKDYEEARRRLQQAIEETTEQILSEQKLLQIRKRRLQRLQEEQAKKVFQRRPKYQLKLKIQKN